ncbi:MAG: helix-turn-helix domain-containing protein [Rhodopseudomonas palustris]|uniref:Helix-turn-helix domain-containing protein n=1 Tax=Rhodopseudomonas palustris TaxID=1076 RepID=A0A933S0P8_RHOPL|nr:helix-turn-helix domain-containing protein [Rhodopseudomonas palustris]
MPDAAKIPVNALLRGLLVLEAVNAYGPVGLSDVRDITGLPKATALRLLESLRQVGYLSFDETARTYTVGLRALALSNNISHQNDLVETARPIMDRLRLKLGWPSDLAIFQLDKMVIVDTNRKPGMLSSNRSIGSRVPMMASATGRVYLANMPPAERAELLGRLRSSSDPFEKLARNAKAVDRLVKTTLERGYAISDQEFLKTNRGAAVAVEHGDEVVCVINLIAIASLATLEDIERRYIPMLFEAKAELEEQIRGAFPPRHANAAPAKRGIGKVDR